MTSTKRKCWMVRERVRVEDFKLPSFLNNDLMTFNIKIMALNCLHQWAFFIDIISLQLNQLNKSGAILKFQYHYSKLLTFSIIILFTFTCDILNDAKISNIHGKLGNTVWAKQSEPFQLIDKFTGLLSIYMTLTLIPK